MFTLAFWKAAGERALKTVAQALIAVLTVDGVARGWDTIDWPVAGWTVFVAGVASLLFSIVSAASTDGSPSLTSEHLDAPAPRNHDDPGIIS